MMFLGKVIPGGAQSVELRPDIHTKMLKLETKPPHLFLNPRFFSQGYMLQTHTHYNYYIIPTRTRKNKSHRKTYDESYKNYINTY